MNTTEYKRYHETFMSNNHGSSALHTFWCIMYTVLCSLFTTVSGPGPNSKCLHYMFEYIFIVLPMIAAHTMLADYIYLLNISMFFPVFHEIYNRCFKMRLSKKFAQLNAFKSGRIQTISAVRGLTYLITVLCILAVDFKCFPRELAKTEKYGYSLMDTGVGLFVLISGLVHKDVQKGGVVATLKSNAKFISILLCLGVGRYLSVKQLDYHEHITEYGVHWNFFFTIAVCKLVSSLLLYCCNKRLLLSIVTLAIHEFLLYNSLEEWVFGDTPRTDLISANREGISSSLGYVSMYLFAAHFQSILHDKSIRRQKVFNNLLLSVGVLWGLVYYWSELRPASRTLANACYCIYVEAILWTIILVYYCFEVIYDEFSAPLLLTAVNTNGLTCFLLANLMTGAINLSIRTLLVSTEITFLILNVYMTVLLSFIVFLKLKGLKI